MTDELSQRLVFLADKYESPQFLEKDPAQFMHLYSDNKNMETAAFIAANLAFGRRDQILSHVKMILNAAENSPYEWIIQKKYTSFFNAESRSSFYRMYTHHDMTVFFDTLKNIFEQSETLGSFCQNEYNKLKPADENSESRQLPSPLSYIIQNAFPAECSLIPHTKDTAAKKINMFLRWMVRDNSPVDLGLWNWYPKDKLLIPLDTHVMQEATKLCILSPSKSGKPKSASLKTAVELTREMHKVFPTDPARADFALFGLGVDQDAGTAP